MDPPTFWKGSNSRIAPPTLPPNQAWLIVIRVWLVGSYRLYLLVKLTLSSKSGGIRSGPHNIC